MNSTNSAESEGLTFGDAEIFEAARAAVSNLKRTFDEHVIIGRAVGRAREIADARGGGKTFMRLVEQQGLHVVVRSKSQASNYERIMSKLAAVIAWRETLTENQRFEWAAPTTILRRCPAFAKPKAVDPNKEPRLTPSQRTSMALAQALDENARLKRQSESGDLFSPSDTAADISTVIASVLARMSVAKARQIHRLIGEAIAAREANGEPPPKVKPPKVRQKRSKKGNDDRDAACAETPDAATSAEARKATYANMDGEC